MTNKELQDMVDYANGNGNNEMWKITNDIEHYPDWMLTYEQLQERRRLYDTKEQNISFYIFAVVPVIIILVTLLYLLFLAW